MKSWPSATARKNVRDEKQGEFGDGDVWTWVELDADTRLVPCWVIAGRCQDTAKDFMANLVGRIYNRFQLTTDRGYNLPMSKLHIMATHKVVDFTFIDDRLGQRPLIEAVCDPDQSEPTSEDWHKEGELRTELEELFKEAGWNGSEGKIMCYFLPPCFRENPVDHDTRSIPIFHVKQQDNGISWLAIPYDLELAMPKPSLAYKIGKSS